jgi:hypothetical protein
MCRTPIYSGPYGHSMEGIGIILGGPYNSGIPSTRAHPGQVQIKGGASKFWNTSVVSRGYED